jgi:hypothetical protein
LIEPDTKDLQIGTSRNVVTARRNKVSELVAVRNRFRLAAGPFWDTVYGSSLGGLTMQQVGILTTGAVFLFLGAILIGFI